MFQRALFVCSRAGGLIQPYLQPSTCQSSLQSVQECITRAFSVLTHRAHETSYQSCYSNKPTLHNALLWNKTVQSLPTSLIQQPSRTLIKFSQIKGKRKTVLVVPSSFRRLDWGGWIRRRAGAHKKLWKRSIRVKKRKEEHVLVNATQATLLDKMVGPYWRTPKYWVDDPYAPYHQREEFPLTRKKPLPLPSTAIPPE